MVYVGLVSDQSANLIPAVQGESRNPWGLWGKRRPAYEELSRALMTEDNAELKAVTQKVLELAKQGVEWAVKLIYDRIDGPMGALTAIIQTQNLNANQNTRALPELSVVVEVIEDGPVWDGETIEAEGVVE